MSTLEVVKQNAIQVNLLGALHTRKLLSLLEGTEMSLERWKLEVAEHNFVWYITAKHILKFKYHVNIRGNAIKYYSETQAESYVGDMPDFAIDRAELALTLGIRKITLHSMNPLPVKRIHIDPVMVGWLQDPAIRTDIKGKFFSYQRENQGVVLAVWDNEKELEL